MVASSSQIVNLPLWMWSLQIWSDIVTSVAGVLMIGASLLEMTPAQAVKLRVTPLLSASCLNESSMGGTSLRLPTSHGCCWLWFAMLWYFLPTDWLQMSQHPLVLHHCTVNITHYTDNNYSSWSVSIFVKIRPGSCLWVVTRPVNTDKGFRE